MRNLQGGRAARFAESAKDRLRGFRDAFFDTMFPPPLMSPASRGGHIPTIKVQWPEPQKPTTMQFSTGDAHSKRSPAYEIAHWKSNDILTPGESPDPGKKQISYRDAQKELGRILRQTTACHEYLAYESAKLLAAHAQVVEYTTHLVVGAGAEDFVFAPGEKLDNICLTDPSRFKTKNKELAKVLKEMSHTKTTFMGVLFHVVSALGRFFTGGREDLDSLNRPYFGHFYNGEHGLTLLGNELKFQSASDRIKLYWKIASDFYQKGDIPNTFTALGHMMHLVQDLHAPAHVHNDPHGPGNLDSLEGWTTRTDYGHIARLQNEANVRIWNSKPLSPPSVDAWDSSNIDQKLMAFIDGIVVNTQRFRSVDAKGTDPDQQKTGKLSNAECFAQAQELMPLAILNGAQIVVNFLEYQKNESAKKD
ncbi:MAG: hypothetical protein ABID61_06070 [Candidatus Micrarchaeota archaeon]